jgi:hypothetical protein
MLGFGVEADAIEQDGLTDPTEAIEDKAAAGPACLDAIERDLGPFEDAVAAGKLGRRVAGSRRVGVQARIHLL